MLFPLVSLFLIGAFCGVIGTVVIGIQIEDRTERRLMREFEMQNETTPRPDSNVIHMNLYSA